MKVIHWTPKENKEAILKEGILLQDTWISCAMLTPFHNLNCWWLDFYFKEQKCVGVVFELKESDFPLVYSHWVVSEEKEYDDDLNTISCTRNNLKKVFAIDPNAVLNSIEELKTEYKETIIWRIGDTVQDVSETNHNKIISSGNQIIQENKSKAIQDFFDNPDFMEFVFEDYEMLIYNSIAPERIEKVIDSTTHYPYIDLMEEIKNSL